MPCTYDSIFCNRHFWRGMSGNKVSPQPARKSYGIYRYLSMQPHDVCIFSIFIRSPSFPAHVWQPSPISGMLITGKLRGQIFHFHPQDLTRPLGFRGDTHGQLRTPCVNMGMSCVSLLMILFSSPRKRSLVSIRSELHSISLIHPQISILRTRRTSRSLSRRTSKTAARVWVALSGKRTQFATARLQRNSLPRLAVDQLRL